MFKNQKYSFSYQLFTYSFCVLVFSVLMLGVDISISSSDELNLVSPGDVLQAFIPGSVQPEQTYTVDIEGNIDLGVYGTLNVGGKSIRQAESVLKNHLNKYLRSVDGISLYVKQEGRLVLVTGCVASPGVVAVEKTDDLWQAIYRAGGLSACADTMRLSIYRKGLEIEVNLREYLTGDKSKSIPSIMTGDTIFVPSGPGLTGMADPTEVFLNIEALRTKVFVIGAVSVPGIYNLAPELDLLTLIAAARGPVANADLSHIQVITKKKTVTVDIQKSITENSGSRYVLPEEGGVIVFIPTMNETLDYRFGEHINALGSFTRPGRIPVSGPISLIDAIGLAGGFSDNAKIRKLRVIEEGTGYTLVSNYNLKRYLKKGGPLGRVIVKPGSTIALGRVNLEPISLVFNAIGTVGMLSSTFLLWVNYGSAVQVGGR